MKAQLRSGAALALVLVATGASAETPIETQAAPQQVPASLFGSGKHAIGGYAALEPVYSRILGRNVALGCFEAALLADHALSIGGSICGVGTRINAAGYSDVPHHVGDQLGIGYGGLAVRYHFFAKEMLQFSAGATVGGGTVMTVNPHENGDGEEDHVRSTDGFFMVEPRLTGYLNLTRWARVGVFGGYRLVAGTETKNISAGDLSGPTLGGTIQFGWF